MRPRIGFAALRLPRLTGYLLCGLATGPDVLGLLSPHNVSDLRIVNGVAVSLIALTAGSGWRVVSDLNQNYNAADPAPTEMQFAAALGSLTGLFIAADYSDGNAATNGTLDRADCSARGVPEAVFHAVSESTGRGNVSR